MIRNHVGWVVCLCCGHTFYLEEYNTRKKQCCPSCKSSEYEPEYSEEEKYRYLEED